MSSASGRSTDSSTTWATASSPTARRSRASHPDRDAQFQYINRRVKAFQRQGQPVVSVDTKKKELVGQLNGGREWQPKGKPKKVKVHDFPDKDLGKAIPYGVYDLAANTAGSVSGSITTLPSSPWRRSADGGEHGQPSLSAGEAAADHGRRRRLQREPLPAVEGGTAAVGRRDRAADLGVPFPAGHEQVEQDRASAVLSHHGELAGPPAGEP